MRLLHTFICYFKSLFQKYYSKKNGYDKLPLNLNSDQCIEGEKEYNEQNNALESTLQVWDVYWCRMPLQPFFLEKIPKSHRIRPYVIYKIDEIGIWGYPSSSKKHKGIMSSEQFYVWGKNHNMYKDSYFDVTSLYQLPFENIISYAFTFDDNERKQFMGLLLKVENPVIIKCMSIKTGKTPQIALKKRLIGEILKYQNEYFLVLSVHQKHYYVALLNVYHGKLTGDVSYSYIIKGQNYYTHFRQVEKFNYQMEVKYIDRISENEIQSLALITQRLPMIMQISKKSSNVKKHKQKQKNKKELYYVSGVYKDKNNCTYLCIYRTRNCGYGVQLNKMNKIIRLPDFDELEKMGTYNITKMVHTLEKLLYLNNMYVNKAYQQLKNFR